MINKEMLKHLTSIGSNNTDIYKEFNADKNLLAHCTKHHGLACSLTEPEDDNVISQMLRKFH